MRSSSIQRNTRETQIQLTLNLDGTGKADISTGCGFLDHMLELFSRHGDMDLTVRCKGDTYVDYHHTVEDIGICLGQAFTEALGEKEESSATDSFSSYGRNPDLMCLRSFRAGFSWLVCGTAVYESRRF